jgi:small GTP-binding protein
MTNIKLVTLGNMSVGKTSLVKRWLFNTFDELSNSTVTAGYDLLQVENGNNTYAFQIWDTAGQERFKSMTSIYCCNANCAVIVFSLTDRKSFSAVSEWINHLNSASGSGPVPFILVGNKCDLPDIAISDNDISTFCGARDISYFSTSAKVGTGVEAAFKSLVRSVLDRMQTRDSVNAGVDLLGSDALDGNKECC